MNTTTFRSIFLKLSTAAALVLGVATGSAFIVPPDFYLRFHNQLFWLGPLFTVNTESNTHDINPGDGKCLDPANQCSLRAAIEECNAGLGFPARIALPAGTFQPFRLDIMKGLSLYGAGADSTFIDGGHGSHIFVISNARSVLISGVTIQNANGFIDFGTGISIDEHSAVNLVDSVVSGNESGVGGVGISNSGHLKLIRTTIRDNVITGGGGGITGVGAGIFNGATGVLEITESTLSNNTGIRGGAIANGGNLKMTNTTISGNIASAGGGINNFPRGNGPPGAGFADIRFCTITNNEGGRPTGEPTNQSLGGGINNLGQVNICKTILAGNRDGRDRFASDFAPDCSSKNPAVIRSFRGNVVGVVNANFNLQDRLTGDTQFDLVGSSDSPLDPRIDSLANNGGPTQTHALHSDSPALDLGSLLKCVLTDQRGQPRETSGIQINCDAGSFERP
jgi:hypothetical protein